MASPPDGPPARRTTVGALLTAALSVSLAQTVVLPALPALHRDLGAPVTSVTWAVTAFMLAGAVVTPIAGRLGDLHGHRRVLIGCLAACTAGTAVTAAAAEAHSLGWVVAGRVLQGTGGGVFPLAFGIVRTALPARRVPGAVALVSAAFGIGGSAGLVVAGPVVGALGTPWLFWGTLAPAAAALALACTLPAARPAAGSGRVDVGGAVLLSAFLVCVLLGISQGRTWGWGSAAVLGLLGAAAVLLAAFAAAEARGRDPLVDLGLLRRRGPAATNLATLVIAAPMFGSITLIPQLVQAGPDVGLGLSPAAGGLVMLPVAALMLVGGPAATPLARRFGGRAPLLAGAACAVAAFALLAAGHHRLWQFLLAGGVIGIGYGLAFAAIGTLTVQSVEQGRTGMATGVNTIVRTVGAALGAQAATALLAASAAAPDGPPSGSGYTTGFAACAAVAGIAVAVAACVPAGTPRPPDRDGTDRPQEGAVSAR